MNYKIINKNKFKTNVWSGGETSELYIFPEDSEFINKDFLFRISSANFTSTFSTFSNFTGYERYILPLEGELNLNHKRLYDRSLKKYEVEYFNGFWETSSINTLDCIDYNFIVKSGYSSRLGVLEAGDTYESKEKGLILLFSTEDYHIKSVNENFIVEGFSLLVIENDSFIDFEIFNATEKIIVSEFIYNDNKI